MSNAQKIARGGLYTALTVLIVYFSNILPTSKLSLLTLASAIIPFSILTTGVKNSAIVYAASAVLAFLIGAKGMALSYAVFFGLYGFVKYYVESLRKTLYEIPLKLVYFNLSIFIIYKLYSALFTAEMTSKLPVYAIIAAAEVGFVIYDYALTEIIAYIDNKFIKKKKTKGKEKS
ncbi:hypothetical protein [Clostridium oryzae]|uniref:DUF2232 domain-containing protein n=1 Tax=Clostridium oryzae TaxID=1450648 RepID=A0A1V4IP18_9CLOT|nr:hypothetical protein [Clostridium oryzae]OPJ61217.1 hypothetical protein CLORY_24290 [Clostridium oryzae]